MNRSQRRALTRQMIGRSRGHGGEKIRLARKLAYEELQRMEAPPTIEERAAELGLSVVTAKDLLRAS